MSEPKSKSQERREAIQKEAAAKESGTPFYYPKHNVTIKASNQEEADAKLAEHLDKLKAEDKDNG